MDENEIVRILLLLMSRPGKTVARRMKRLRSMFLILLRNNPSPPDTVHKLRIVVVDKAFELLEISQEHAAAEPETVALLQDCCARVIERWGAVST